MNQILKGIEIHYALSGDEFIKILLMLANKHTLNENEILVNHTI